MITPMGLDRAPWPTCDPRRVHCGVDRLERRPAIIVLKVLICTNKYISRCLLVSNVCLERAMVASA